MLGLWNVEMNFFCSQYFSLYYISKWKMVLFLWGIRQNVWHRCFQPA